MSREMATPSNNASTIIAAAKVMTLKPLSANLSRDSAAARSCGALLASSTASIADADIASLAEHS